MAGQLFYVPMDVATTPADGACLVDNYWVAHPEKGLAFHAVLGGFKSQVPAPQCNVDRNVADYLQKRLYPDHVIWKVDVVYLAHALREMKRLQLNATLAGAVA